MATACGIATLPLRIDPRRIGFLRFILEGYDGMAVVTTVNAHDGMIVIRYPRSFHQDLLDLINDLASSIAHPHDH